MSQLTRFLKQNKAKKENTSFAASESFTDENGKPLNWVIKPLTSKENEEIRDMCMVEDTDGVKSFDFISYKAKILCACIAEPNLYDADLQDSYEVRTPEELIYEMVNGPGEYDKFVDFVFKFNGIGSEKDKVEKVKN